MIDRKTQMFVDQVSMLLFWNKFFVGGLYEEEHRDGKIEQRHYIPTPAGVIGVWLTKTDGSQSRQYMVNDHLGSSSLVVTEDGSTISEYSYDAWGNPHNPDNWALPLSDWPDYPADRGFTGHEMLAKIKLVHMNARIYDPVLGRFLSPDTYIQFEYNQQSYNRYSYVVNNPMRYTDPSGNFVFTFAAAMYVATAKGLECYAVVAIMTAASIADSLVQGATIGQALESGAYTAVATLATMGIGKLFGEFGKANGVWKIADKHLNELARAATHGLSSGLMAEARGGNFGSSFMVGFAGSLTGEYSGDRWGKDSVQSLVVAAAVGGTTSEIGGGKFANGAACAAMIWAVNQNGKIQEKKTFAEILSESQEPIAIIEKAWLEQYDKNSAIQNSALKPQLEKMIGSDRVIVASSISDAVNQIEASGLSADLVMIFSHVNPKGVTLPRLFHAVLRTDHWVRELGRVTNSATVCGVNCQLGAVTDVSRFAGLTNSTWYASDYTVVPAIGGKSGNLYIFEKGTRNQRVFDTYKP